jgi:hypothetical protein
LTLGTYSGQCAALEPVCPGSNPGGTQSPKIRSESLRLYFEYVCAIDFLAGYADHEEMQLRDTICRFVSIAGDIRRKFVS